MTPEIATQLRAIFDAHDDAIRALRDANQRLAAASDHFDAVIHAHDQAIQAAHHANRAALDLLARLEAGEARLVACLG